MDEEPASRSAEAARLSVFLFRQAFRDAGAVSRRHFLPLFFIMLCGAIPRFLLVTPGSPAEFGLPPSPDTNMADFLLQVAVYLASAFASLIVLFASLEYLAGLRIDYKAALRWAAGRLLFVCIALALLLFFAGLLIAAVTLAIALLGHGFAAEKLVINTLVGLWAFLSLLFFYISFFLFAPVVAIERRGFWPSVWHALFLTRGRRWKIFLVLLAAAAAYMAIATGISLIGKIPSVAKILPASLGDYAEFVGTTLFGYLATMLQAVLYYRLRQIKGDPLSTADLL